MKIMIDAKTNIQYEIMTDDQLDNGKYVPNFDKLIAEAPNETIANEWADCRDLIERTKDSDFPFGGFAFRMVCVVKQACGHYEIFQHPYHPQYDDITEVLTDFAEENRKCTMCICGGH